MEVPGARAASSTARVDNRMLGRRRATRASAWSPRPAAVSRSMDAGAPVSDVIDAARDAGKQLVEKGEILQATLDIVSRDLLPVDVYVKMANEQFRKVMERHESKGGG